MTPVICAIPLQTPRQKKNKKKNLKNIFYSFASNLSLTFIIRSNSDLWIYEKVLFYSK